jgi:uncharacterized protein
MYPHRMAGIMLALACAATPVSAADGDRARAPAGSVVDPLRFGKKPADAAYGAFQRGLYITALNLALPRARDGDAAAQTLAAEIYSRGLGVRRDPGEAAFWYAKAAEQGVPEAQFQYALILIDGEYADKDEGRALALMKESADAGNLLAMFNYAQMVIHREPNERGVKKAIDYYSKAAERGLADAQYAMSQILATGATGEAPDEAEARRLLLAAARQNYDTAQLDLATWLVEGRGGPRDMEAGFGWMKRAAESGNIAAQKRLAMLYWHGLGVEPDSIQAAAWYIVARRAGLKDQEMDDFFAGLTVDEQKQALERANRLR